MRKVVGHDKDREIAYKLLLWAKHDLTWGKLTCCQLKLIWVVRNK